MMMRKKYFYNIYVIEIVLLLLLLMGCAPVYPPSYATEVPVSEMKSLKLVSFTPKTMKIKSDTITSSYNKFVEKFSEYTNLTAITYLSVSNAEIEDGETTSFSVGITSPSIYYFTGIMRGTHPAVFEISIANIGEEPITIRWDNLSYIDAKGISHKVIKSGTRIIERDRPVGNVLVPPNAKIVEMLQPTDSIYYSSGDSLSNWYAKPVLEDLSVGDRVTIFIPIEVKGQVRNYSFVFEAQSPSETTKPKQTE